MAWFPASISGQYFECTGGQWGGRMRGTRSGMQTDMKKIALVGCGRIMGRHIEAIATAPGSKLPWFAILTRQSEKNRVERLGVPYVTDYRHSRCGCRAILTPSGLHPQHVTDIAEQTDTLTSSAKSRFLTLREATSFLTAWTGPAKLLCRFIKTLQPAGSLHEKPN